MEREVRSVPQQVQTRAAVFLDRDGTIIEEVNYLRDSAEVRIIPAAIEGLLILQEHFPLVIITNQAGIARGYLDENQLDQIHGHLRALLAQSGISLAGIYYCPHHPQAGYPPYRRNCRCRKPKQGMLLAAAADLALDLSVSYTIGDKLSDIAAGKSAGTHTILVRTGYGKGHEHQISREGIFPDYISDDLLDAAAWIMESQGRLTKRR
ncbi:MAG: HAD family hydrolase [Firmicutes bacterium]|nr:HAD family hydrolase [Bacillota bacterium]